MKKLIVLALVVVVSLAMAATVIAVPAGKTVDFAGGGAGKVVFDGKSHADKGAKCADCHQSGLFKMKKGGDTMKMADMEAGKFCGACHNGTKSFGVKDQASCGKCHKK